MRGAYHGHESQEICYFSWQPFQHKVQIPQLCGKTGVGLIDLLNGYFWYRNSGKLDKAVCIFSSSALPSCC